MRFEGKLLKKSKGKPALKLIEGGKKEDEEVQPRLKLFNEEPPVDDWLTPMTPNTIFLAVEKKTRNSVCTEFTVCNHSENAVKLKAGDNAFWVIPTLFCQGMELIDVLQRGYDN